MGQLFATAGTPALGDVAEYFQVNARGRFAFHQLEQLPASLRRAVNVAQNDFGKGIPPVLLQRDEDLVGVIINGDPLAHARLMRE
jgi:hypothetical protein